MIEIEVESISKFKEALVANPDIIMLDNFLPDQIRQAIQLLRDHERNSNPLIEISGGINEKNFKEFL